MAKTKIEWADENWNPIVGCSQISETYEAMAKYCAFLKGDTKDSQAALYPELQKLIEQEK